MYQISNFTDNDDVKVIDSLGPFSVVEYQRDLSGPLPPAPPPPISAAP